MLGCFYSHLGFSGSWDPPLPHPLKGGRVSGFKKKIVKKESYLKLRLQSFLYICKFILGSAVGGRVSFNSIDDHDAMDGKF